MGRSAFHIVGRMTIQNEAQVRAIYPYSRDRPGAQGLHTDLSDSDIFVSTWRVIYAGYFTSR